MARRIRTSLFICLLLAASPMLRAQDGSEYRGWSYSQRFQGSSNAAGVILKTSSTAGYAFNRNIKLYAGVPVYFARETSSAGDTSFMNGIGNVYSGVTVNADASAFHYSSDLVATVPTGDRDRGFSTGHATVDWTNTFSHSFNRITPYASIGAANTISDTSFFVRPFSSKGIVSHFEAGALMDIARRTSIGASAYGIRATGEQEIISKVVERPATSNGSPSQGSSNAGLKYEWSKEPGPPCTSTTVGHPHVTAAGHQAGAIHVEPEPAPVHIDVHPSTSSPR